MVNDNLKCILQEVHRIWLNLWLNVIVQNNCHHEAFHIRISIRDFIEVIGSPNNKGYTEW